MIIRLENRQKTWLHNGLIVCCYLRVTLRHQQVKQNDVSALLGCLIIAREVISSDICIVEWVP